MSKALAKQAPQEVAQTPAPAPTPILASDATIPYLLLMQGMSTLVMEDKARLGDMVKSSSKAKLGDPKQRLEFIPIAIQDQWIIGEVIPGKTMPKFVKTLPRTPGGVGDEGREEIDKTGERLEFKFKYLGKDYVRTKTKNVFALLPAELKEFQKEIARAQAEHDMPDFTKQPTPIVIGFKNKSFKAGKAVYDHFLKAQQNAQYGALAHGYTLELGCHQEKNDKGIFYVYDVYPGRKCEKEEFQAADKWYRQLDPSKAKIDEGGLSEDGVAEESNSY